MPMPSLMLRVAIAYFLVLFSISNTIAQAPKKYTSGEILLAIKKLNVCGSVLYLAAHPDDENTNLITVLANEKMLNTAYLSLTRGDGGQNLIGTEQGDLLGIIRTQELLQARKIDGGKQLFTRARDFGFSKLPDETFSIWEKDKVLADVVWAVRSLQPDIIITRFSLEPGKTHGHHTASAMLGVEAFDIAGDTTKYPEQLTNTTPWQPKRVVWNSSKWFYNDDAKLMARNPILMDCGHYNAVLGKSYNEISAESRSMHKSQGFGSMGGRGSNTEYFEHLKGIKAEKDIFEGIDLTWNRVPGGAVIVPLIAKIIAKYQIEKPSASVVELLQLKSAITQLHNSYWKKIKLEELNSIIKNCLGLYLEVASAEPFIANGEKLKLNIEAINRSDVKVVLESVQINDWAKDTLVNKTLESNKGFTFATICTIPIALANSQPYWLQNTGTKGMFEYAPTLNASPENLPFKALLQCSIDGQHFIFETPIVYKKSDPVDGEVYKPLEIGNPIFVNVADDLMLFTNEQPKNLKVTLRAGKANAAGEVTIQAPKGWRTEPNSIAYKIALKNEEQVIYFNIFPSANNGQETLTVTAQQDGKVYQQGYLPILHKHISAQVLFPPSVVKVVKFDLQKKNLTLGYIMGAGDEVPQCLEQVGYKVTLLNTAEISLQQLKKFDALLVGVRAFNTLDRMKFHLSKIFQYVAEGGNVIVQYNTSGKLLADSVAPYLLKLSNDRVTVENAPITFLKPTHPVLNQPNKITDVDFQNWVQERGLYFPNQWGKEFEAILSCNDPAEPPRDGGLLIAKYGKGNYIYTGLSFFRELPAGVPGAYRLLANMIALGKK